MKNNLKFLFWGLLACLSLSLVSCSDDDDDPIVKPEPEEMTKTAKVQYSCEMVGDFADMVYVVLFYTDKDGKEVTVRMEENKWMQEIEVEKPFDANLRVKFIKKEGFIPTKESYSIAFKAVAHTMAYSVNGFYDKYEVEKAVETLCKSDHVVTDSVE